MFISEIANTYVQQQVRIRRKYYDSVTQSKSRQNELHKSLHNLEFASVSDKLSESTGSSVGNKNLLPRPDPINEGVIFKDHSLLPDYTQRVSFPFLPFISFLSFFPFLFFF